MVSLMSEGDFGGRLIHYSTIFLSAILVFYSLGTMLFSGVYSYIYPPGGGYAVIHSLSLFSLSLSFLVYYLMLGHLYPLVRSIVCLTITVWSIHTYDFFWSLFGQAIGGTGFSWGALVIALLMVGLIERFDNKHGIIKFASTWTGRRLSMLILYSIFILSFQGLVGSGFYQGMALYTAGMGPDPNVGNIYWLMSKFMVFWLILPLIDKRDYKAPLRLDPKVLFW